MLVRDRWRFIAEVKTGRIAPSLAYGATRRQLLEYAAAFDVDGVLLVDADRGTITHVEVDVFAARRVPQPIPRPPPTDAGPPPPTVRPGLTALVVLVIAAVSFGAGALIGVAMAR